MIPKSPVMTWPSGAYQSGDEAKSQDGGLLTKSSVSTFLTVALKFKIFTAIMLEYLYDITDTGGDRFRKHCGTSHVLLSCKMLLQ